MSTASKKTTQTVKLADMRVSGGDSVLVTHALGSCLGLMIYDPAEKVGGLLHAVLPLSTVNPERAMTNPFMFVDLGVPRLFRAAYELGAERARLVVKAAGCGSPIGAVDTFRIGLRNYAMLKRLLRQSNLTIESEAVGGPARRMVRFDLSTGRVIVKTAGKESVL